MARGRPSPSLESLVIMVTNKNEKLTDMTGKINLLEKSMAEKSSKDVMPEKLQNQGRTVGDLEKAMEMLSSKLKNSGLQ